MDGCLHGMYLFSNGWMCACMLVCIYGCIYVHVCMYEVYMYIVRSTCLYLCVYFHTEYVCTYGRMFVYVCSVRTGICLLLCVPVYVLFIVRTSIRLCNYLSVLYSSMYRMKAFMCAGV